jgi:ATP-dependent Clp protease adapter protein ClpS
MSSNVQTEQDAQTSSQTRIDPPWHVILFNDEVHTFDQVILQLQKATGCSLERAFELTLQVHHNGKAAVFFGPQEKCLRVSSVLERIGLATQVEIT